MEVDANVNRLNVKSFGGMDATKDEKSFRCLSMEW